MSFSTYSKSGTQMRIEETRQWTAPSPEGVGFPRGVLKATGPAEGVFSHARLAPPASLVPWVQHFWMVEWDLRDAAPRLQETLPHPSVYLVFEQHLERAGSTMKAEIAGVMRALVSFRTADRRDRSHRRPSVPCVFPASTQAHPATG